MFRYPAVGGPAVWDRHCGFELLLFGLEDVLEPLLKSLEVWDFPGDGRSESEDLRALLMNHPALLILDLFL